MITIYGKDTCPYTMAAVDAYRPRGAEYVNVKKAAAALARVLELTNGRRVVPVILEDGVVTIGYGGT